MADKRIWDRDLQPDLKLSQCYTIKSLYGIPKTFFKILNGIDKQNKNRDIGYQLALEFEVVQADESNRGCTPDPFAAATGASHADATADPAKACSSTLGSSLDPNFRAQEEQEVFDYGDAVAE